MTGYQFYWESDKEGGARLLRAFGETAHIVLPDFVCGIPITEIGPYCFAKESRLPASYRIACVGDDTFLHELSGDYIESVVLPDSVQKLGSFAFYNCRRLKSIEFGGNMHKTGGDVFMNCRCFSRMKVRGDAKQLAGAACILAQVSSEVMLEFGDEEEKAVLLFPEYTESYDEIAPAHIFGRSIAGEGVRARQCIRGGMLDFSQYDDVFPRACAAAEPERTLCEAAVSRLCYPAGLSSFARGRYHAYVREHAAYLCKTLVEEKRTGQIEILCENGLLERETVENAIFLASQSGWAEGVALLFSIKERYFSAKTKKERYAFAEILNTDP